MTIRAGTPSSKQGAHAHRSSLRVALIGYGLAGRFFHAPLIAATDGLELAGVVTSDPQRRAEVVSEHPTAALFGAAAELWARDACDLVVVAAPNEAHAPLAREALARGIPVVVDKPLALSVAEAEMLVDHSERAGVLLTVFHNRRWDSDHLTLQRLLSGGELGEVIRYESRFERWRPQPAAGAWRESTPPERGGGQLLDLGSHLVDQALTLFGAATQVYAEVASHRGTAGDDDAFVALRHAGGVISHLRMSAVTAAPGPRLRVLGTAAAFTVADVDSQEDELRAGGHPGERGWGIEPQARWGRLVRGTESELVRSEPGNWPRFYEQLEAALRGGLPAPVDPRDAVAALRVLAGARESATSRSVVAL